MMGCWGGDLNITRVVGPGSLQGPFPLLNCMILQLPWEEQAMSSPFFSSSIKNQYKPFL